LFRFTIIDELDVTFSNKKTRYLYTYSLQSPDLFTNINDSDQTESVYSFQSKSTSNNYFTNIKIDFFKLNINLILD